MFKSLGLWLFIAIGQIKIVLAHLDHFQSHDFDIASHLLWKAAKFNIETNDTLNAIYSYGCNHCSEIFYSEPPPADILFIPPPPPHPSYQASLADSSFGYSGSEAQHSSNGEHSQYQCNFCNIFDSEDEQLTGPNIANNPDSNHRVIALLIAFLSISGVLLVYILTTRRNKILASLTRTKLFESNARPTNHINHGHLQMGKNNSINESLTNASGSHLSDPCYLQTNRDKNLTSPIINDHVNHKKTSIPSKYWAQPGSIIGRTIRRIPNEYEVPSSRTNSTGTSSAIYADMTTTNEQHNSQRFFSPYNLHTYAEVREVLDPNEHFHTSSNSSAMMSDSNYDQAGYSHGGCLIGSGAPNGSVQMSDFNPMRAPQPMVSYGQQPAQVNNQSYPTSQQQQQQQQFSQSKIHLGHGSQHHQIYEQPPQRAQVIITSNNQGVNPTLLNYKDRVHNVI